MGNCPNCGAPLQKDKHGNVKCDYCGFESMSEMTENLNHNNKKRTMTKHKYAKYLLVIVLLLFLGICFQRVLLISKGYIFVYQYKDFIGDNYRDVQKRLNAMGFTNIILDDLNDAGQIMKNPDEVVEVTINGKNGCGYYHKEDNVIIRYH